MHLSKWYTSVYSLIELAAFVLLGETQISTSKSHKIAWQPLHQEGIPE